MRPKGSVATSAELVVGNKYYYVSGWPCTGVFKEIRLVQKGPLRSMPEYRHEDNLDSFYDNPWLACMETSKNTRKAYYDLQSCHDMNIDGGGYNEHYLFDNVFDAVDYITGQRK